MNSRKMESLRDTRGKIAGLEKLLPKPPARLAAVAWDDDGSLAERVDVHHARRLEALDGGPFDALLWSVDAAEVDVPALWRARRALASDGRLLLRAAGDEQDDEAVVRGLVRRLSEAGFVVTRELGREALPGGRGPLVAARPDDFVVRAFEDGDEAAIARLFTRCFHAERSAENWRWKYHENPWGNRLISLAFSPQGELVAHYAGYPMPFWLDGRSFLALHMGDTMTDPRFRDVGRGTSALLARTVRHFFAVYRQGPMDFFYGFNTGPIQRFCRWFIGGSQATPVAYRRLELRSDVGRSVRGYRVERVTSTSPAWNRFFRRVAPCYRFLGKRDARYVDWRYLGSPDGEYVVLAARRFRRLVGWSVFRRREERLLWGDALFHPRHAGAAGAVLAAARELPELRGAEAVAGWFPERPAFLAAELRRLGFVRQREPEGLGFIYLPDTETDPPLDDFYYTMGDGDLF